MANRRMGNITTKVLKKTRKHIMISDDGEYQQMEEKYLEYGDYGFSKVWITHLANILDAIKGLMQLGEYLEQYSLSEGYLLIFNFRKTNRESGKLEEVTVNIGDRDKKIVEAYC